MTEEEHHGLIVLGVLAIIFTVIAAVSWLDRPAPLPSGQLGVLAKRCEDEGGTWSVDNEDQTNRLVMTCFKTWRSEVSCAEAKP